MSVYGRAARPSPNLQARIAGSATTKEAEAGEGDFGAEDGGRAERIVSACLAALARHSSISASMRQMARVGNRDLVGAGRYVQAGTGEDQRFRFESSISAQAIDSAKSDSFDLIEVSDGVAFWSYQKNAELPPMVHRVDIRRVRNRLEEADPKKVGGPDAITRHLGGLQRTLSMIRESFRFASVESAEIDGMPVWRIEGRWDPERLKPILPDIAGAVADGVVPPTALPDGMPWSVVLSIGKRELFPFRVEWYAIRGPRPVVHEILEKVAVLEFYEVRIGEPVDATSFVYKPAVEGLVDVTDSFAATVHPPRP